MTMPDVLLLPVWADTFGVYIDELFSRKVNTEYHCAEFPWPDDTVIRGVVCELGKSLNMSKGLMWCIKRYTDDEIVLQGCGDDEYIFRRSDKRIEIFTAI